MDDAVMMFISGSSYSITSGTGCGLCATSFTGGEGSLRSKYNAAVPRNRATRKRLDEPVAAEHPKRRRSSRSK